MTDQVLIPLPGIGTLSLIRAEYEAALVPVARPEHPKPAPKPETVQQRRSELSLSSAEDCSERPRGLRYIRLREVCQRVGLRQSTIYRLISLGRFPKQVKLSEHAAAWIESEVEQFMAERIVERDQALPTAAPSSPYIRMSEAMKRTGLDSSTIYELIRENNFPKWANLPKIASGWFNSEVEAWIASRTDPLTMKSAKDPESP